MSEWIPARLEGGGPRYLDIVNAIENDIASGVLRPGKRLLPHRDMAERLGVSVGTISKAYGEAVKRGLIAGAVGRGTFVLQGTRAREGVLPEPEPGRVNLALNAPPRTGEGDVISATLKAIADEGGSEDLLVYLPHQGKADHLAAVAGYMDAYGMPAAPGSLFITHGAQHALSMVLGILAKAGHSILTESRTYAGMLALAGHAGYNLRGVRMDADGLIPEELDRTFAESGARVLFCTPTLQTPMASIMPQARREEIAEVILRHDAYLVEDDAYGFLCDPPVRPLAALIPDRAFYVISFAKCLAPGLRIGAMHVPLDFRDRCINAIRASGWMGTPIMAEVVKRLILDGRLDDQIRRKREIATRRQALARRILGSRISPASNPSFHIWLPVPAGRTVTALVAQVAQAGITVAAPPALLPYDPMTNGVRLCLGTPATDAELEHALGAIFNILDKAEAISLL